MRMQIARHALTQASSHTPWNNKKRRGEYMYLYREFQPPLYKVIDGCVCGDRECRVFSLAELSGI